MECADVIGDRPLRQGDIVSPLVASDDHWRGPAVVITADCDLARNKHNGRLSCVPILTLKTYLGLFFLPPRLLRVENAIEERFAVIIRKYQSALDGFDVPISSARAAAWVFESSASAVACKFDMSDRDCRELSALENSYSMLKSARTADFELMARALRESQVVLGRQKSDALAAKAQLKELVAHVEQLPGDAMFLNSISTDRTAGYVCYLRLIREISDHEVATKPTMRSFQIRYERISHLCAPFVYALSQKLGAVFSAIGLPDEYETARRDCGESLAEVLGSSE